MQRFFVVNTRLIPRLDIKGQNLIKGVHLEGLRVVGDPRDFARKYYAQGADELIYMDVVASLYGRNNLEALIKAVSTEVYIPMTVGGGIRSLDNVDSMLRSGADKVAINTAAVHRPELIDEISKRFGSQCLVLSIEAKRSTAGGWEAYTDNGRERTGRDVLDWAREATDRGAGEILLTSVDQEGTRKGFDLRLITEVSSSVSVPVIASGGMGAVQHAVDVITSAQVSGIAVADMLHFDRLDLITLKKELGGMGCPVRQL